MMFKWSSNFAKGSKCLREDGFRLGKLLGYHASSFYLLLYFLSFSTNSSAFRYLGVMGPGLLEERVISLFVCLYFVRGINELVRDSV